MVTKDRWQQILPGTQGHNASILWFNQLFQREYHHSVLERPAEQLYKKGVVYNYDALGRVINTTYREGESLQDKMNYYAENIGYDKHGNMSYLLRQEGKPTVPTEI